MVMQRSMNTVPIRLHIRRKRMDLRVVRQVPLKPVERQDRTPFQEPYLCLWSSRTNNQMLQRMTPHASAMAKAHGILGTLWKRRRNTECQVSASKRNTGHKTSPPPPHLSRKMSGSGGYVRMSGTLSCTMTMTKEVNPNTNTT